MVSRSLYCFNTSISHGVENYFLRLWGTGVSDAIFCLSGGTFSKCTHSNNEYKKVVKQSNIECIVLRMATQHPFLGLNVLTQIMNTKKL